MEYQVHLGQVQPQPIAVVRRHTTVNQLSQVVPQACGEVWNYARANGLPGLGRHVAVYLDECRDLEVGVEVAQPFTGTGQVICSQIPLGLAATTAHFGPYHRLGDAHGAVRQWCRQHGHMTTGVFWEVYGHWTDDAAQLRTDVYYLLQPAANPPK